jgi:hypothetical protein
MESHRTILGFVIVLVVSGCSLRAGATAEATCMETASSIGSDFTVAGAFSTTVGEIRSLIPGNPQPPLWPDLASNENAILCYLNGPIAKSPPGPNGQPYDRAAIAVFEDRETLVLAGYHDQLAVTAP